MNLVLLQFHVPLRYFPYQIVEHMDQQILVMGVPNHLVTIHGQMVLRAFGSIVLFKCRYFEIGRYDQLKDQAQLSRVHTFEIVHTLNYF